MFGGFVTNRIKKYIYDDYGIDVDKTIKAIKNNTVFKVVLYFILTIFGLIFAGVYSISLLMLSLAHPNISLFILIVFIALAMYVYYREFIDER